MARLLTEACAASELRRLLPALKPLLSALPPTAAGIISATAHFVALPHRAECPVQRRTIALSAIAGDAAFLARPCAHCTARRAHFLAGADFAAFVSRRCATGPVAMPPALEAAVAAQFGSRAALESALIAAAAGRAAPGHVWLACDARLRLAVAAPPPGRVPLADGHWPIAAVDVSPRPVLAALSAAAGGAAGRRAEPPRWSRAARNAASAVAAAPAAGGEALGGPLAAARLRVARDAVAAMNWEFVQQQWSDAAEYYKSPARADIVVARRAELEREAALAAMARLRDSGATILTSDTVEIATRPVGEAAATAATSEATTAPVTTETTTTESEVTDPECTQLSDGTWEYRYRSGDVTLLRPDGTRVFKRSDLTTTVYASGGTLFEYPNGTSIFDRPDGVRVTTFADGTTTEEQIQ